MEASKAGERIIADLAALQDSTLQNKRILRGPDMARSFSILTNLTPEQQNELYPDHLLSMNQHMEKDRFKRKREKAPSQERPTVMRSEVVGNYYDHIMKETAQPELVEVFKDFYKYDIDTRIFNNMKQQLNEMVEDEQS